MIVLKMKNGIEVQGLEDLRKNCDMTQLMKYYRRGELEQWLRDLYYEEEADAVKALDEGAPEIGQKLCKTLGIPDPMAEDFTEEDSKRLEEKIRILTERGADETILALVKQIALSQKDLATLLNKDIKTIYLCGEEFSVPLKIENVKYIGILGTPKIRIKAKSEAEIESKNISFENVVLPWGNAPESKQIHPQETDSNMDEEGESPNGNSIIDGMIRPIYREDTDLEILAKADNEDLMTLVSYLTKDKNGDRIITEALTSTDEYKKNPDNPQKYWRLIAAELQRFGGNTAVNIIRRGEGVLYKEILCDVCDKMKVEYNKDADASDIELSLLEKITIDAIEKMDDEQREELVKALKLDVSSISHQTVTAAVRTGILAGGVCSIQVASWIAYGIATDFSVGTAASIAGFAAGRVLSFLTGAVGMVALTAWAFAGPAYRVTVPAVIQVAYIRLKAQNR